MSPFKIAIIITAVILIIVAITVIAATIQTNYENNKRKTVNNDKRKLVNTNNQDNASQVNKNKEIEKLKILKVVDEINGQSCTSFPRIPASPDATAEDLTRKYVNDYSAIFKREFWTLREYGIVLIYFGPFMEIRFVKSQSLTLYLDENVAYEALKFLNTRGIHGKGLIVIGRQTQWDFFDWTIQDFNFRGRDVGLPYLVD